MTARVTSIVGWGMPLILAGFAGCGGAEGSSFDSNGGSPSVGTGDYGGVNGGVLGSTTGGSTGTSTGGGGIDRDAACAAQAQDTKAIPVDIFIMLDKSGSMNCPAADNACEKPASTLTHPTRWEAVTTAINSFVSAPASAGTGVGIGFFSLADNACTVANYAKPRVAISALPANAAPITGAIGNEMPSGSTPTVPALQGSINYAASYMKSTPGRSAAVVFVTDGLPNGCSSTIPNATKAAKAAFAGTPQVKTYVVGLGATQSLDEIALAGSGGATHFFPATGDVAAQLTAALKQIAGAITCDYVIPNTPGKKLDFQQVNVEVKVGAGGTPQFIGNVANGAACAANGGWFYDDPAAPSKITLCPQSCDPLKGTEGSTLQVLIGCATQGPPIN